MKEPLVSVIIPTYKRTWEYLHRAVVSVLGQSYKNFELIVIDDSPEIYDDRLVIEENMTKMCEEDSRIIYLMNEKNLGGALARNRGIEIAKGVYTTFLDDDDEYLPEKLRHQVDFMQKCKCDLSFENMIMYNEKDIVVDVREYSDLKQNDKEYLLSY